MGFATLSRSRGSAGEPAKVSQARERIDYEAAKEAQERAQKEWPLVGAYGVDPNYKGKGLQLEFTVEDEGAFTMPWKATVTYRRAGHEDWQERVCAENIEHYYTGVQYYSDKDARIPTAEKPDF